MTFKLIDAGGMRGMPALHFYLPSMERDVKKLDNAIETFNLVPGKRFAVISTTEYEQAQLGDEGLELTRVLRDWGFHVSAHIQGASLPSFAREVNNLVTFVEPGKTWLQFTTNNLVYTGIPEKDPVIQEQNARSPRFLTLKADTPVGSIAKFLKESKYTWAVQIGGTGGMEVEI